MNGYPDGGLSRRAGLAADGVRGNPPNPPFAKGGLFCGCRVDCYSVIPANAGIHAQAGNNGVGGWAALAGVLDSGRRRNDGDGAAVVGWNRRVDSRFRGNDDMVGRGNDGVGGGVGGFCRAWPDKPPFILRQAQDERLPLRAGYPCGGLLCGGRGWRRMG